MADQNQYNKLGLIDYLNTLGQKSDFGSRKKLYNSLYFNTPVNYQGTAEQNKELVNSLRDSYIKVGSNLGNRQEGDALRQFVRNTMSRSVFEGNRPTVRPTHPMESYEYKSNMNIPQMKSLEAKLFGSNKPNNRYDNYLTLK